MPRSIERDGFEGMSRDHESFRLGKSDRIKEDGFVKSPSAALRYILRHCGVPLCTPHSSGFARLASEAFYFAILLLSFYDFIKENGIHKK